MRYTSYFHPPLSLGPLVSKVKGNRVEHIVDVLGNNMLSTNEQLRDISTMGNNLLSEHHFAKKSNILHLWNIEI